MIKAGGSPTLAAGRTERGPRGPQDTRIAGKIQCDSGQQKGSSGAEGLGGRDGRSGRRSDDAWTRGDGGMTPPSRRGSGSGALEPDAHAILDDAWAGARALVERLGPHPTTAAGLALDPDDDRKLGAWWTLCCLLDTRGRGGERAEALALAAYRTLAERGAAAPQAAASLEPGTLAAWLEEAGHPRAEAVSAVLWRGGRTLAARYDGSLARLSRECDDLEGLGARLAALAPGFGRAGVVRFLQPLRDGWPAATGLPLDAAAAAAAVHLRWLPEDLDDEARLGALRARLGGAEPPRWIDVEAALSRLGRRSCLRGRTDRCPLGRACPARGETPADRHRLDA